MVCGRWRIGGGAPRAPAAPPTPRMRLPMRAARCSGLGPPGIVEVCPLKRLALVVDSVVDVVVEDVVEAAVEVALGAAGAPATAMSGLNRSAAFAMRRTS